MPFLQSGSAEGLHVSRPMVKGLFVASCLLAIVSFYTTEQGMALYLSGWFALLAALGVQSALVLVAWLIGFTKTQRALLIAVYAITATVSIGFSYVSLYTWFSARERPALVERKLYDSLGETAGKVESVLAAAISEGQKHVLALDEMTGAEKAHGYISRAADADPYLSAVREAVAREAQTYSGSYKEGSGEGLRYTAFDRYAKMARQSVDRMQASARAIADFRAQNKPLDPSEKQLRLFHQAYDQVPWNDVQQTLHGEKFERPAAPVYSDFIDRTVTGQEDLMLAFQELFTAPTARHIFSFVLAAFIDIIVFLLAFASGPYFFGPPQQRWVSACAALDGLDSKVFVRNFLAKLVPGLRGMARVESSALSSGEQQLCILLASKRLAAPVEEGGRMYYLLDEEVHESLLETLASGDLFVRASSRRAQAV